MIEVPAGKTAAPIGSAGINPTRADLQNAACCAGIVVLAMLLCFPVADLPYNDDWSYAFTVQKLAQTGHVFYNGWSLALLITQAWWGSIWVQLFGFSFGVLRASMMPIAAGSVSVTYLLARRAGLAKPASYFCAMLLGLSPLFLPLACSFMTDVPGCFCMLLAVYGLSRCMDAVDKPAAEMIWLLASMLAAVAGGLTRQAVWIVPLAVLPYLAWMRRQQVLLLIAATAAWLFTLATAVLAQRWLDAQPFALPGPPILRMLIGIQHDPELVTRRFIAVLLTLVLLQLPALLPIWTRMKSRSTIILAGIVLLIIVRWLYSNPRMAVAPWMENTLASTGLLGSAQLRGQRPVVLPPPVLWFMSIAVFMSAATAVAVGVAAISKRQRPTRQLPFNSETSTMLVIVCIAYSGLLLNRASLNLSFDRYLLPLIPLASIPLLRVLLASHRETKTALPSASWVLLAIFGFYGIASTQDDFALARARVIAANRVRAAGIPRTQISAGLEYDFWTQLETSGHINDPRIKNPSGTYKPGQGRTPDVKPLYVVEHEPQPDSDPSEFGSVSYVSFLPPFHRRIVIDRLRTPLQIEHDRK